MSTPIATAVVIGVQSSKHARTVTVRCPFGCKRPHVHGWPPGDTTPGVRAAHCGNGQPRAYRIPTPGDPT